MIICSIPACNKEIFVIQINGGLAKQSIKEIIIDNHHSEEVRIILEDGTESTIKYDCSRLYKLISDLPQDSAIKQEQLDYPSIILFNSKRQEERIIHSQTDLYKEVQLLIKTFKSNSNY